MLAGKIVLPRINTDFSWVELWILLGMGAGVRYEIDWMLLEGDSCIKVRSVFDF